MTENCTLGSLVLQIVRVAGKPLTASQIVRTMKKSLGKQIKRSQIDKILINGVSYGYLVKSNYLYSYPKVKPKVCMPSMDSLVPSMGNHNFDVASTSQSNNGKTNEQNSNAMNKCFDMDDIPSTSRKALTMKANGFFKATQSKDETVDVQFVPMEVDQDEACVDKRTFEPMMVDDVESCGNFLLTGKFGHTDLMDTSS
ncbi:hypothetical protein KR084_008526 [Drosophila pseudotakahashii]|nr:hypothetical protein KR084_008526 [Drosophila pseudotakahashii]